MFARAEKQIGPYRHIVPIELKEKGQTLV